ALLHEALQLSPTQPLSADALANEYSQPAITPLFTSNDWRYAATPPAADWFTPSFSDVVWPVATAVSGFANYSPRSERAVIFHTNIWLRQQFDLPSAPTGKVVLRLNRSHDAEIFLNGVPATPTMDWSDTPVLVPCTAPLNVGRNTLAVHCGDVDGATTVGVAVYVSSDASLGRKQLLAEFDRLIQKEPQRAELYAGRASVRARLGQWTEAAADLSRAVALSPETLEYWYQLAPLLVETGNLTGYAQHRRDALNRFLAPDSPTKAAQVTELSLLTATDGPEQESATKLADFAGNAAYADYWLAWRQLAKGLAEYRQGRFASAVDWMEKVRATAARQDRPGWTHERERNRTAAALLVQAMAHHRLNQADEARTSLATATEIIQTQFPQLESGDVGRDWPDWLIAHILQREAMALIGGNTVGS
ncbi:MAG TPA: hypothetical protein VLZ12_06695, partial [Verrucomicrobiae bacterium]|nr:hypothetical protein [Verrucomicrobiae bacterium]